MELLNPSIFKKPLFTTNPSSSNHFNTFFPFPTGRNFQISAHFRRHSKRRNSLRKKLSDEQKVSNDTDTTNLQYPFHITDESYLNNSSIDSVEKSKLVMWSKLESWVDQYKKEVEFWGVGSSPIFTVFQDIQGNVKSVVINEDEILRRNRVEPSSYNKRNELGEEVKSTISYAKRLGKEIEMGGYKFPSNSSIAKVVVSGRESGFVDGVRSFVVHPEMYTKLPRIGIGIGIGIVCSFFVFWFVKEILFVKNSVVELTREEKEMLRRKMKLRMEKEKLESGSVEVLPVVVNRVMESTVRPQLDKQELMNSFSKAKTPGEELMLPHSSSCVDHETRRFSKKLQEIKEMARHAREIERKSREEHEIVDEDVSTDLEDSEIHSHVSDLSDGDSVKSMDVNATRECPSVEYSPTIENGSIPGRTSIKGSENNNFQVPDLDSSAEGSGNGAQSQRDGIRSEPSSLRSIVTEEGNQLSENLTIEPQPVDVQPLLEGTFLHPLENSKSKIPAPASTVEGSENGMNTQWDLNNRESSTLQSMGRSQEIPSTDLPDGETYGSNKQPIKVKPKIMLTVKEAREYLSQKRDRGELDKDPKVRSLRLGADDLEPSIDEEAHTKASQMTLNEKEVNNSSSFDKTSKMKSVKNAYRNSAKKKIDLMGNVQSIPLNTYDSKNLEKKYEMGDYQRPKIEYADVDCNKEARPVTSEGSWMEKNFQEFEPIVKKIGDGFRENYTVAKQKAEEELNLSSEIHLHGYDENDGELDWMKDDSLREIVFQVRENELMGRDPFHMMNAEDKQAFFSGLERKVEKESAKLLNVHEWVHSRIENLAYGADGISLYDSPEKIIPRWKGPTVDKDPEFLTNPINQRKSFLNENDGVSHKVTQNTQDTLQSVETPASEDILNSSAPHISRMTPQSGASKKPKTVIECSDGSSRPGKKSGKEYWQHTKKWSREFLELYNTETDPEVKSIMKDMGKDLNRWITDKEIQETADLMTKIPKRKRRYIEKKLEKLKSEMKMFGPQAVVGKYREYAEEEEDYLWWLDLPHVLCIELYTNEDGDQKVGFYSLEMAEDLELDPKQYHVIAFEDPGDSKSFCYIIQTHLELLGKGSAFVVVRPPKDCFREAKANGFSVTVIRKGELQLNVDQSLEEVEEQIAEIGSKVYHDKIMRERSVDMGSLMKGVFGSSKLPKRGRSKKTLKKLPAIDD